MFNVSLFWHDGEMKNRDVGHTCPVYIALLHVLISASPIFAVRMASDFFLRPIAVPLLFLHL